MTNANPKSRTDPSASAALGEDKSVHESCIPPHLILLSPATWRRNRRGMAPVPPPAGSMAMATGTRPRHTTVRMPEPTAIVIDATFRPASLSSRCSRGFDGAAKGYLCAT